MHLNSTSKLVSVEDGIATIEVEASKRWLKLRSPEIIANQILKSWIFEEALKSVIGFEIIVQTATRNYGFAIRINDSINEITDAVNNYRAEPIKGDKKQLYRLSIRFN